MPAQLSYRYFIINKPAGIVSQFVSTHAVGLLGNLNFDFPEGTHAVGRLDKDSEGLLILTTDKRVTRLLFLATQPHKRSYLVMVQNKITPETFSKLKEGIPIRIKDGEYYTAKPTSIEIVEKPEALYKFATDRRDAYPHTWLLITLTEGKYRQVRKMVLAAKHRCQRLIRLSISNMYLNNMYPGEVKELEKQEFFALLGIREPE
ncbi:MAG: rRNA pseudouridine synthase [Bacteroidetes bacterium]|nr:rRNA pseudouridine synthase [Bacteroidota bacterium]MBS1756367.1 rRNA pseudouridine synthase [Bacteroidota bacterium]